MKHNIFISYSSKKETEALEICHILEKNNFPCWIATRDIPAGETYSNVIDEAICHCKIFLLIFDEFAAQSNWVERELNIAVEEKKAIIPYHIDKHRIQRGAMRLILAPLQWVDASDGYIEKIHELIKSISRISPPIKRIELQSCETKGERVSTENQKATRKCNEKSSFHYYAYISAPTQDEIWALWLNNRLDNYRIDRSLRLKDPVLPFRLSPNFRSNMIEEIFSDNMKEEIYGHLYNSQYLIIICSPRSAKSRRLGFEIESFLEMGKANYIIPIIIEGEPFSNNTETECLHPILREKLSSIQRLNTQNNINLSPSSRKERTFIQVVSRMINVDFDILWSRHRSRKICTSILFAGLLIATICLTFFMYASLQSFDMEVHLQELDPHTARMPLAKDSYIELKIGQTWLVKFIDSLEKPLIFHDIDASYRDKELPVRLKSPGLTLVSSQIKAAKSTRLYLAREVTNTKIVGWVRVRENFANIPNVKVNIKGKSTTTDSHGRFELTLPLGIQDEIYEITLTHKGKKHIYREKIQPRQNKESDILEFYLP